MKKKQKVLVIVGPTSSGKSALAVALAKKFNGEVISADSRQVYRGLNIGTGKITRKEMKGVRHHLLDIADPKKTFTAHDFIKQGRTAIADIAGRGKLPIIAGGTGFYIDALLGRITLPDVPANKKLRALLEKKTAAQLFTSLRKKDPHRAQTIDAHNKMRLVRALEIATALGKSPTPHIESPFDALWTGIEVPRKQLERKIHERLRARIEHGMLAEAGSLHSAALSYKRMESLGLEYRSLARFLQKRITQAQLIAELDIAIHQYAKRQITYWKRNKDIRWSTSKSGSIHKRITTWLQR